MPIEIIVDLDTGLDNKKNNILSFYRLSLSKQLKPIDYSNGNWGVKKLFVKEILFKINDDAVNINFIRIFIGKKEFLIQKKDIVGLRVNINNDFYYKIQDKIRYNNSLIPIFNQFINWPGDLYLIIKSFPIFLMLIVLFCLFMIFKLYNNKVKLYDFLICFGSILLICLPLLNTFNIFYFDWEASHIRFINYYAKYFLNNFNFPLVINSYDVVLSPNPIYYGYLFYPFAGLLSIFFGAGISLRIIIFTLFLIQYYFCKKLILNITRNNNFSNFVSIIITWSIYTLTNVYNRAAITEFVATMFAALAFNIVLIILIDNSKNERKNLFLYFTIFYIFCFLTHPITALYFSFFLVLSLLVFIKNILLLIKEKEITIYLISSLIIIFLAILPWLISTFSQIGNLNVINEAPEKPVLINGIDNFFKRFSLILLSADTRIYNLGISQVSTPYLDTQVNMPILVFIFLGCILGIIVFERKKVLPLIFSTIIFIFFSLLSLSSHIYNLLPNFFKIAQFCYRIVTYQNLSIFLILVVLLIIFRINFRSKYYRVVIVFVLTISLSSVFIKLEHINAIKKISDSNIDYYETHFSYYSYLTPNIYLKLKNENINDMLNQNRIKITIDDSNFGLLKPLTINTEKPGWYLTNVGAFSWNRIYINKKILIKNKIRFYDNLLAIFLEKGINSIKVKIKPPLYYLLSRYFSYLLILLIFLSLIILNIKNILKKIETN